MDQNFPLHIHWDGSIPAKALFKLSRKRKRKLLLPEEDISGNRIDYKSERQRIIRSAKGLEKFMHSLRKYKLTDVFNMPISFMQTKKDIMESAVMHCNYLKSQNCPYAETRFAPQYHTSQGLSIEQIIYYAVEGLQKGKEETGVDARLIISIGREAPPEDGKKIAMAAVECNKRFPKHILGIDLACEETSNPPEKHYPAFRATFGTPLKRTVHAGEMCDESTNLKNIETAIFKLKADGLGHAIPLHKSERLMQAARERSIRIESNPESNSFFFGKDICLDLKLEKLMDNGLLVTINPDDPEMIPGGHIKEVMKKMESAYGKSFVQRARQNAVRAAWGLGREEKEAYLQQNINTSI